VVMADRPGVARAAWPIAATDAGGMAGAMAMSLLRVPLRHPLASRGRRLESVAVAVTRETMRQFIGYTVSLPIDEFRSVELAIDRLCEVALTPAAAALGVSTEVGEVGGVPGVWYRRRDRTARGSVLYLHGGGYVGGSPRMYGVFAAELRRSTGCDIFVADYRLAPEFPFPAGRDDALAVLSAMLEARPEGHRVLVAGDSGGGGLVTSVVFEAMVQRIGPLDGTLLLSPEVDLELDDPSLSENAARDILPWNIPTAAYLHGRDPASPEVSALHQDLSGWPPTFVAFGGDEMLRDSIRRFTARLEEAGVPTESHEEPGMFHVFPILMPWAAASRRVHTRAAAFVDARFAPPPGRPGAPSDGPTGP